MDSNTRQIVDREPHISDAPIIDSMKSLTWIVMIGISSIQNILPFNSNHVCTLDCEGIIRFYNLDNGKMISKKDGNDFAEYSTVLKDGTLVIVGGKLG